MPETPQESFILAYPKKPIAGVLSTLIPESRANEFAELERENTQRVWKVRGIVSDHLPLAGTLLSVLERRPEHQFYLNGNLLSIYLHSGGRNAVYYDLVGDEEGRVRHIEVQVETPLPGKAIFLAWRPMNALLDSLMRMGQFPWALQRLELISPRDGEVLAYELVLPFGDGIRLGPLGGIQQSPPFAPYDAIFREANTSPSPFYKLLCAYRVYEGTNPIRRWLREQCERLGIAERLPRELEVDLEELIGLGLDREFVARVKTVADMFEQLRGLRDAIAHFLIKGEQGSAHVYLADGEAIRSYSTSAGILLLCAHRSLESLRDAKLGALAKLSRSQRELVMVIRPMGKGLMCHAMYYANEVRQVAEFQVITEAAVTPQEVKLATKLLGSLEGPFEPENYEDGYQARLAELLDKKQKGETVTATPAPTPRAPAVDMLAALQASLDAAASKRGRSAVQ